MTRPFNLVPNGAVRRRNAFAAVCLWCLFIIFYSVPCARAQHRFDSWTTDNGLPHNSIRAIRQTRDGYLWVATINGIARFDGVRFRVFNKANTPALTTNHFAFRGLWEDRRGTLWIGTYDGGVIRYCDGRFSALTTADGLPSNRVLRIDEDEEGTVWIFTEGGLAQWKDGQLIRVAPAPGSPFNDYLGDPRKYLGVNGHAFGLWRMDSSGWQRFAYGRWTPLPLPPRVTDAAKLRAYFVYEDAQRNLWYSLDDRDDEFYLVKDGRLSILPNVNPNDRSYICYQDVHGRVWSGNPVGLNGFWKDGRFTPLPELVTTNVFDVIEDREGGLWIATFFEGLYRFREQFITFHRHAGGVEKTPKTAGAMIENSRGDVWLRSAALARFRDGRFTNYYRAGRTRKAWDWGNIVSALYEDRDGSVWAGTWDGIVRVRDGQLYEERLLSEQIKGRVHAIRRDRAGDLWFGMESGGGLYRLRDGSLTHYTTRDGLAGNTIDVILEDRAGRLWIGTDRGVSRYTGTAFETPAGAEELSSAAVSALHEDAAGVLWVGTWERGLYRLETDQERIKLTRYTTEQGLYTDRMALVLEDDTGFVWMACNLGLSRVRKQELEDFAGGRVSSITSTWFGKAHGLINEENGAFAEPVGYGFKGRDGKLWFSTREGIAVVDPRAVPFNPAPPPVAIEECVLDRQPAEFENDLRISPGQENVEIHYTALSLKNSEQARFRYRLEGLDREWVEAGTRRVAYYSHVPPGGYTFRVIAANSDGVWNMEGQSLSVVVLPPFYRTWWFVSLAALSLAAIVFLVFRYRVGQLHRRHEEQQAFSRQLISSQEQERKRIAAELHDSLGQHLLIIKNRAALGERFTPAEGQAREQFDEINTSAAQAIGEVRAIAYNLRPLNLDRLGLTAVVEEMIERVSGAVGVRLSADIEPLDDLFSKEDEISFYRIIQESVNNIVKHSRATKANVEIWREDGHLHVTVSDNGRGFDPEALANNGAPRGFGLTSISERVRMLGGTHTITSTAQGGTTLNIVVPLTKRRRGHLPFPV